MNYQRLTLVKEVNLHPIPYTIKGYSNSIV